MKPTLIQFVILVLMLLYGCSGGSIKEETASETTTETVKEPTPEDTAEDVASDPGGAREVPITSRNPNTTSPGSSSGDRMTMDRGQVVMARPDISPQTPIEVRRETAPVKTLQSKKLAVHCPRNMTYKKTSDVIAFVADLIDDETIKEMMKQRVADASDREDVEINDRDMLIRDLQLYEFIELKLDDADNEGFTIKKIHETDKQKVSENMEGWHWKVTPTNSEQEQQLVLKVIVYDQNSEFKSFDKTYRINIKIESGRFFRNTYALAVENPEWAFATLIIPFLTFLWGRYKAVRSRRKKEEEESA